MPFQFMPGSIEQITPACAAFLSERISRRQLKETEYFCKMGDLGVDFLIVDHGLLVVERVYPEDVVIPVQFVPPGRSFAPSATPATRAEFQIRALSAAQVTCFPSALIYETCLQFPQFAQALLASVVQRTNDGYLAQARMMHVPANAQLAHLLWWLTLSEPFERDGTKRLPWRLPQGLLANYLGIPREEVSRKFKSLQTLGHLEKRLDTFYLNESLLGLFKEYGAPSPPVSFIASGREMDITSTAEAQL